MKIRKLKQEEHRMTRSLWEEIFTEDDEAFLDYYYQVKTAENSIYIIRWRQRWNIGDGVI